MTHATLEYDLAKVLLVDDDPASRLTLQTVLTAGGYAVDSAASAAEAKSPDAGDALQELTLIAECIARDELSVADLTQFRRSIDRQDDTSTPTD